MLLNTLRMYICIYFFLVFIIIVQTPTHRVYVYSFFLLHNVLISMIRTVPKHILSPEYAGIIFDAGSNSKYLVLVYVCLDVMTPFTDSPI